MIFSFDIKVEEDQEEDKWTCMYVVLLLAYILYVLNSGVLLYIRAGWMSVHFFLELRFFFLISFEKKAVQ